MTIRVITYRDKPRADLLPVSAMQEPIVSRAVTYGPSTAIEGGPRFCPFVEQSEPYKSLQLTFDSPLGLARPSPHVESNAAELRRLDARQRVA